MKNVHYIAKVLFLCLALLLLSGCVPAPVGETSTPSTAPVITAPVKDPNALPSPTPIPTRPVEPSAEPSLSPHANAELLVLIPADQDQGTIDLLKAELYNRCYNFPPALASTTSAFPDIMQRYAFDPNDAVGVNYYLYHDRYGGILQEQLLKELQALLDDEKAQIYLVYTYGWAQTTYARATGETMPGDDNFRIMEIIWDEVWLNGREQLLIVRPADNIEGWAQIGLFDLSTGFQRCISPSGRITIDAEDPNQSAPDFLSGAFFYVVHSSPHQDNML